jgi:hypothetical protein
LKFYLDTFEFTGFINWFDLKTKIKREDSLKALLISNESNLQFTDKAYEYLYNKLNLEGFCSSVDFEYIDDCDFRIKGIIYLSDTEFNEKSCVANCKLEDNSYVSKIKNNAKIETSINHGKSKNGETITIPNYYMVDIHNVSNNALLRTVKTYRVYDVLRYLVDFMSDKTLIFESNIFNLGGEFEGLCITIGEKIRLIASTKEPQISFEDLFNELNKKLNLVIIIKNPFSSKPTICIESNSDYYLQNTIAQHTELYSLTTKCEVEKLYNQVSVGSSKIVDESPYYFPENIDYVGWREEDFFIIQKCNIDNELELDTNFAVSSNTIQKIAGDSGLPIAANDTDDNELFLIDTILNTATTGRTTNDDFLDLTPPRYFYNYRLTNSSVLNRYIGGIPNTIAKFTNAYGDGLFSAVVNTSYAFVGAGTPVLSTYTNVLSNVGGYYNGSDRYAAPVAGVYTFLSRIDFELNGLAYGNFTLIARRYSSTGTLLEGKILWISGLLNGIGYFPGPFLQFGAYKTFSFILNAGDYVQIYYDIENTLYGNILTTSAFECIDNTIGGGNYQTYDPDDYPVYLYEYNYPISSSEFKNILDNCTGFISFEYNGKIKKGWIKEIEYNYLKSMAKVILISYKNAN